MEIFAVSEIAGTVSIMSGGASTNMPRSEQFESRRLSGRARTDKDGQWTLALSDIGLDVQVDADPDLFVVATPMEHGAVDFRPHPSYLVAKVRHGAIAIWSFGADGDPAPWCSLHGNASLICQAPDR
jgi:hypothetical protein